MTTQNLTVTARERDTLLAALRYYQFYRMQGHPFDPKQDHLIDIIAETTGSALDLTEIVQNAYETGNLDVQLRLIFRDHTNNGTTDAILITPSLLITFDQ